MNEPDILYPAIFVFSMLVIGLLLTVWEFTRMQKSLPRKASKVNPAAGPESEIADTRAPKLSGL